MRTYTLLKIRKSCIRDADMINVMRYGDIKKPANDRMFEAVALIHAHNAEDAFDLDNHPSRVDQKEGHVVDFFCRSPMTVGDVLIDNSSGIYQVCMPRGFQIVSGFEFMMPQINQKTETVTDVGFVHEEGAMQVNNFPNDRTH